MSHNPDDLTPPHYGAPGYVSPYGKPRGLRRRLAEWADKMGSDRSLPWAGLGIIGDLKLAASILNKREWLEAMRLSNDPDAQRFAAELLADDESLDAAWNAAEHAKALPKGTDTLDPVAVTEALDAEAVAAQRIVRAVRAGLERNGLADENTPDEMLADLLGVLLG